MSKLRQTLESVWYAAGPAQYLMYAVWTVVVSGMFALEDGWQLVATIWKFLGVLLFVFTIWGTMRQKLLLILTSTITTVAVGAIYTSKAVMFADMHMDVHRAATQSHYMVIAVLVAWGFYLANLISRQMMEFEKMGISDG